VSLSCLCCSRDNQHCEEGPPIDRRVFFSTLNTAGADQGVSQKIDELGVISIGTTTTYLAALREQCLASFRVLRRQSARDSEDAKSGG
jgi:hypothetical protein